MLLPITPRFRRDAKLAALLPRCRRQGRHRAIAAATLSPPPRYRRHPAATLPTAAALLRLPLPLMRCHRHRHNAGAVAVLLPPPPRCRGLRCHVATTATAAALTPPPPPRAMQAQLVLGKMEGMVDGWC